MAKNSWYTIKDADAIDSPSLIVFPERVQHNILMAIDMLGDVNRLRPHVKTHKTREVIRLFQQAGVNRFKCATIAEAELLAMTDAQDVLLAYQPIGPKLQRFIQLIGAYPSTRFSCVVDHIAAADAMDAAAREHGMVLSVFIDLNVGMNRTGIAPEQAMEFAVHCKSLQGIKVRGLHAYDGHLREPDLERRKAECDEAFSGVEKLHRDIGGLWYETMEVVAGGTPSFPIHARRKNVQCSPGTFVYWDAGYQQLFPEQHFLPAALVMARVVSLPAPDKICIDLGHKSVAAENPINKRVIFLNAPELKAVSQSEEHLVVEVAAGHTYRPGDVLYGLPQHICPTCALYERAITINEGKVSGEWKVLARDRKIRY